MNKKRMLLFLAALTTTAYGGKNVELDKTVVYSTTGFMTDMRAIAATPSVITEKEIKEKNYKSVLEILNDMSVISIGHTYFGPVIDMRGQGSAIAPRNVQILIDGVAINSLDTSMTKTPINTLSVNAISRIEVIPGGGSVLYGSGTQGGIINIITKEGQGLRGNISSDRASYDGIKNDFQIAKSFGNLDIDLLYNRNDKNGYRRGSHNKTQFLQGKIKYKISKKQDIKFKYSRYDMTDESRSGFLTKEEMEDDRRQSKGEYSKLKTKKNDYNLTYNAKLADNLELNLIGFYQDTEIKMPALFADEKKGIKPKLKYSYKNGTVIAGVDYIDNSAKRRTSMGPMQMGPMKIGATTKNDFSKKTLAVFAMNNYKYEKFEFNQGVRYEKSNYSILRDTRIKKIMPNGMENETIKSINKNRKVNNFAFELSGSYLYSNTGKLYTRLEQGFTSPPPTLLTDTIPIAPRQTNYVLNNIKSEQYRNIEFGWSDYLLNNTTFNTSIFYTLTNDEIYTYMEGMAKKVLNYNIDKTERYGAQMSLEHYFGKLTLSESYNFVQTKIKKGREKKYDASNNIVSGADLSGRHIADVPEHRFKLGAKYQFTDKFNINGDLIYTGKSYIDNNNKSGKSDDYAVINLRAGYSFDNGVDIYAGINNLLNTKYNVDTIYVGSDKYKYLPAPERNYYIGVNYVF